MGVIFRGITDFRSAQLCWTLWNGFRQMADGYLGRIEPFHGYWQTSDYAYWASMDGKPVRRALGEMNLKSEIARPRV
jgi:hypothetical protein